MCCFFFKQKTAYEMRISDWSSDVCSSDLASLNRTSDVTREIEEILLADPAVEHVIAVIGLNFLNVSAASNSAFVVARLKAYEEREDPDLSAAAVIERVRPKLAAISRGTAVPLNVPPIVGLGSTGGFEYALQALQGPPASAHPAPARGVNPAAHQPPPLAGVF